jgi:hypothetical protein
MLLASTGGHAAPGDAVIAVDANRGLPGVQASATYPVFVSHVAVDIAIDTPHATGAFEVEVFYDPMRVRFLGWDQGAFLSSTGRQPSCYEFVLERSIRIGCATSGPAPPGPAGVGVLATLHFRPLSVGQACLVLLTGTTADVSGAALPTARQGGCLFFSPDSDGDGCSDAQEIGTNPLSGGMRDPGNPWDYFDVTGDRAIDLQDALSVLQHFGLGPDAPGADLRDRYAPNSAEPWRTAESDNGVDLADAIAVLASFGHRCAVG